MVKLKWNRLLKRNKGQLFLLEVFIALSVLILLMVAIFQIEFTTFPTYQEDLSKIGYNALESLNLAGELKPLVYDTKTLELADNLDELLAENILWRLVVKDNSNATLFQIYWERVPPIMSSVGAADYFLYGFEDNLSNVRIIHLELWRIMG